MNRLKLLYGILMVLVFPSILIADNYVIINQVMYDSPLNEKTNVSPYSNGEFIELYNAGTSTVSLQGWRIEGSGSTEIYYFSNGTNIPAEGYLILACRRGNNNTFQLSELYTLPNNSNDTIVYQNKIVLANGGETITLYNELNEIADQMQYDNAVLYATNPEGISGDSCRSLHRIDVEFDAAGNAISGTSQWQRDTVSFARCMLPHASYQEDYLLGEQSLPSNENYVLSVTPLDPVARIGFNNGRVSVSSGVRTRTAIQYLDGLGRQEQMVALNVTPDGKDMVSLAEYTGKSKQNKQWLPVVLQTDGQRMDISEIKSQAQSDYDDAYPYTEVQYEATARQRISIRFKPGESYRGHEASVSYNVCDGSEQVRIYTMKNDSVLKTTGENYASYMLYKTVSTDEDGKAMTTYTDKLGHAVLEERNGNRTYYVYNALGRLCVVLPNIASSKLSNGEYAFRNTTLRSIGYCYKYDSRGNVIYKRLPGCAPQYMVYDRVGQLVLMQDGNLRADGKWTMCAYDSIGRNLYAAEITLAQTHEELISLFANQWQVEHFDSNQPNVISGTGYASSILAPTGLQLLTVNYYDSHDFLNLLPVSVRQKLYYDSETGYGHLHNNVTGLLTGTRIYNLSEEGSTITSCYYDMRGNVVQSRSVCNNQIYSTTNCEYLFDGSLAQQQTCRETTDWSVSEHYRYIYDNLGRLEKTYYQLNNDEEILLSELSYDEKGRLAQNLLYKKQDIIAYSYDMRDMLTKSSNRFFTEGLFYADSLSGFSSFVTPCFNGNIAASSISYIDSTYLFSYSYDPLNRLKNSSLIHSNSQALCESFDYDASGNICLLKRYNGNILIDSLAYSYDDDGHQLLTVTDGGQNTDLYGVIEYQNDALSSDTTMRYDANGNLIYDANRGITVIHYNRLNLPDTIQFANGNQIVNLYDAIGHKYKSIVYTVLSVPLTPYEEIMHYTYETETVDYQTTEFVGNIETCYTRRDTVQRVLNTIGYYADSSYYYALKDHLGDICAVVNATADTLVQQTLYYPSGVMMAQSWGRDRQPYFYNGKEFVEAHGLNIYDYGFRGYYATIGRFTSIDPLAESTPWQSPYAYAGNRFINAIDWMGLGGKDSFANGNVVHCIVVDINGNVIGGVNDGDDNIYLDLDGEWDATDGKGRLIWVCEMEHSYMWYIAHANASLGSGGGFRAVSSSQIKVAIGRSLIVDVALGVVDRYLREGIGKAIGKIGNQTTLVVASTRTILDAYNIFESFASNGYNNQAAYDLAKEALTIGLNLVLDGITIKGITALAPKVASATITIVPYILGTAIFAFAGWSYYKACEYFINAVNDLNAMVSSKGFWANLGGFDYDGSNW